MANVSTLDIEYEGLPFATLAPDKAANDGLDNEYEGLPFFAEELLALAAGANTIVVTAPVARGKFLAREFPLVREEQQGVLITQEKHIFPPYQYQEPDLIP